MTGNSEGVPEDVEILPVTFADSSVLRDIAILGLMSWGREPTAVEVEERTERLQEEIAALGPSERGVFVAEKSGALVGFCRVVRDRNDGSQWWLLGLAVHPDHRRRGIGSAIVRECIVYAQQRGATVIRSETHLDNEASIRFHESMGFKNEGRFTAADGDEKVAFSLTLAHCDRRNRGR